MEPPATVRTALADRPVDGAVCLEAGAGVGNGTAGLLDAGAERVYAVTNDREHASGVSERVGRRDDVAVLEADLREIPLPDDSVGIILAHALFGVVPPAGLPGIAAELTRVAAPGAHIVVDDYEPLPADSPVRRLFALENAAAEIATGRPALSFYPSDAMTALFAGHGWRVDRTRSLLDPVPWTRELLDAHLDEIRGFAEQLDDELGAPLVADGERLVEEIASADVGEMYSVAMRLDEG
jgi:SAM-dependent methyltransferase